MQAPLTQEANLAPVGLFHDLVADIREIEQRHGRQAFKIQLAARRVVTLSSMSVSEWVKQANLTKENAETLVNALEDVKGIESQVFGGWVFKVTENPEQPDIAVINWWGKQTVIPAGDEKPLFT
jgi:hypothetical protein